MTESTDSRKNKFPNQFLTGLLLFIILAMIGFLFFLTEPVIAFYWFSGTLFGYVIQRSRFCFVAALRDPALTGSTALARGVLVTLGLSSVFFTLIKYISFLTSGFIPGQAYIQAIGLNTVIGGLLFGVGMVIAGGCASGMLMRIGEGFQIHLITLIFFFIGILLGNTHLSWWKSHFVILRKGIFLPDYLGWFWGLCLQLILIALLYMFALKWEDKQQL
ncbi:YeeE/YedE thiosulfate transporter family protein [Eubacteriaceae bacterium ES2]|nr:YeeE/YedE thiosulfate transporter family protein [Eubacteriaceae bacterium ES2]